MPFRKYNRMEVRKSKISKRSVADKLEASCNLQEEDAPSHVSPRLLDKHQSLLTKGARKTEGKEVPKKCERTPQSKKEDLRVLNEKRTQANDSVDTQDINRPPKQSSKFSIPLPVNENASKLRGRIQVKGKRLAENDHEFKNTNRKQSRIDDVDDPPSKSKEQSSTSEKSMNTRPEYHENRRNQIRSKIDQYKCELKKHEDILKPTLQTCGELYQKYVELEDQKQSKIKEFHRFYRKVNDILRRQSRLEERLELVSGFLDNKSKVKKILCDSIMIDDGAKFRQTLELLENYQNKMNVTQQRVQKSITALQMYEVEISIHEREESEPCMNLDRHIALCLGKANFMLNKSNNIRAEMKELEFSITRNEMNVNSERNQIKANIIAKFEKVQSEIGILRHEKSTMKDRVTKEIFAQKQMISQLQEKLNRRKKKFEQAVAEKCVLEKEIEELSKKEEETNKKLSNIELKFNELDNSMARMKLYNQEKVKRESDIRSRMEIRTKELKDLKEKLLARESEKNLSINKIKHYQSMGDRKKMFLKLQNELSSNIEQKQQVKGTIATLVQEQETKESHIRALELERSAVDEIIQKFQEISASHCSQWQELKSQVDILETIALVKGDEFSSCHTKEQELSSVYSDIHETLFLLTELDQQIEQLCEENDKIDVINQRKQKELEKILDEIAKLSNHEKTIKLFVKEGRYTTKQELNKNQSQLMKWKEDEEMKIKVLKEELPKDKTELEARIKYHEENKLQPNQLDVEKSGEKKLPE